MDISLLSKPADLSPGEWVGDIPDQPGLRLKVRSINYKPYDVATAGLGRRSSKQLKTDEGLVDFAANLGKPLAEHILLDWDGVKNGGVPLPYSRDIAMTVLTAEDDHGVGKGFRRAVEWAANDVADRLAKQAEDAAGN